MVVHYLATHVVAVLSVLLTVHLLGTRRTPQSTLGWLVALVFAPFLAIPAYLFFGRRKLWPRSVPVLSPPMSAGAVPTSGESLQRLLSTLGVPPLRTGNRFTLLPDGQVAYAALL